MKFLAHIFFHVHELLLKGVIEKLHNKESTMKFINELRMWSEKLTAILTITSMSLLYYQLSSQLYSLATEQSFHFISYMPNINSSSSELHSFFVAVPLQVCCCIYKFSIQIHLSHRIYESAFVCVLKSIRDSKSISSAAAIIV